MYMDFRTCKYFRFFCKNADKNPEVAPSKLMSVTLCFGFFFKYYFSCIVCLSYSTDVASLQRISVHHRGGYSLDACQLWSDASAEDHKMGKTGCLIFLLFLNAFSCIILSPSAEFLILFKFLFIR